MGCWLLQESALQPKRRANMCLICTEYQKGKLTVNEAWNNLNEMQETIDPEHIDVVLSMLFFGDEYENISVIDYGQMIEEDDEF